MDEVELAQRFAYHPPSSEDVRFAHERIREQFGQLAEWLNALVPDGREKSLAMTKLDEAAMYANASVARTQLRGHQEGYRAVYPRWQESGPTTSDGLPLGPPDPVEPLRFVDVDQPAGLQMPGTVVGEVIEVERPRPGPPATPPPPRPKPWA